MLISMPPPLHPASAQKAQEDLTCEHLAALVIMKDAEELLGKGQMQESKEKFQSAFDT